MAARMASVGARDGADRMVDLVARRAAETALRRTAAGSVVRMIKPDLDMVLPAELGTTHFVGIGGSGMSGIARLFLEAGHRVTGSDLRDTEAVRELRELGAEIWIGHEASQVGDADTLVVTGALWQDNPEYQEALRRGIPVLHRSQALNWLINAAAGSISIAGAHGKSTSTGMLVTALRELGADPSFVNGGVIQGSGAVRHSAPTNCSWSRPTSPMARSCCTTRRSR